MRQRINVLLGIISVMAMTFVMAGCINSETSVADEKAYRELAWNYSVESDVVFGTAEGVNGPEELKLDIYKTAKEGPNPVVILWHGGGFTTGDKANEGLLKNLAIDYARMGYVVLLPNYRLGTASTEQVLNDAMEDARAAYDWLLANGNQYGADTEAVVFGGYSAGAYIATNLYYTNYFTDLERDNVKCVLDISGGHIYYGIARGELAECVIIHGTADTTVDFADSEKAAKYLESSGVEVSFHALEGITHDVLVQYDEVRNLTAERMYHNLFGIDTDIDIQSDVSVEYQKVLERLQKGNVYTVKQADIVIDGSLEEWGGTETIQLDQVKDAGQGLPDAEDYAGEAMVVWQKTEPTVLYLAARIKDDTIQNTVAADGKWYMDDCLELAFDFSDDNTEQQVLKWVIGIEGEDLSVYATAENTTAATAREGDYYICELAIDISKVPEGTYLGGFTPALAPTQSIGFSICYNDCENATREHQMGWTAGKASDRSSFGTLYFE